MKTFNTNNPTHSWDDEEKHDFCELEDKWLDKIRNDQDIIPASNSVEKYKSDPIFDNLSDLKHFLDEPEISDNIVQMFFKCQKCSMKFSEESELENHARIHQKQKFQCQQCEYEVPYSDLLKVHIRRNHGTISQKEFENSENCGYCKFQTDSTQKLKVHIDENHVQVIRYDDEKMANQKTVFEIIPRWVCQVCQLTFYNFSDFEHHIRTHQARTQMQRNDDWYLRSLLGIL